jgi:hypothetical protein
VIAAEHRQPGTVQDRGPRGPVELDHQQGHGGQWLMMITGASGVVPAP